jgi:hypothetical protein
MPLKVWLVYGGSFLILSAFAVGCSTTTTTEPVSTVTTVRKEPKNQPGGFFERLLDRITERECRVPGFTCPYGLGPADEPCDCTDPSGRVLYGRTIK